MTGPTPAYVGLGSNLDDPQAQVRAALTALGRLPGTRLVRTSSLYRSAPVGPVAQADFVNAACRLETRLAPGALLHALLVLESRQGRRRGTERGGPRTLDLDLLLYGEAVIRGPDLIVPHPRLHERAFVLYPLAEIEPELVVPGRGRVAGLMAACAGQRIERLPGDDRRLGGGGSDDRR